MQKDTQIATGICAAIVSLLIISQIFMRVGPSYSLDNTTVPVVMENGIQFITIEAKGGFNPRFIQAQRGVPTQLHVMTNGTYDCSSTLVIPALDYEKTLQPTGTETIIISADQAQGTLHGTCGMGMYNFAIAFE